MGRARKIVIDDNIGNGNLLYLPLDKMLGGAAALAPLLDEENSNGSGGSPQTLDEFKDLLRQSSARNQLEGQR